MSVAIRRAGGWLAWSTACLVAGAVPAGPISAQGEIFEQGNRLYQEGDFQGAIEAYETVLGAGYQSAELFYNLGNAHFKAGRLGPAILSWERARIRSPGDPDVAANLELARSLTADAVEPLPRFWLFGALDWWVRLLPRGPLLALVALAWLAGAAGLAVRILARGEAVARAGSWLALGSGAVVVIFGANLAVGETGLLRPDRAIVLAAAVPVRSAPAEDDDLTLFEIHEGTRVRIEERAGDWVEIVLDDGKVGWAPADVLEEI